MLRNMKILLIIAVALWGFSGAFGNLTDWKGTLDAVTAATSMSTFEGGAESWRAISNPALTWAGALFIMLSKVSSAVLCSMGALNMFSARKGDAAAFGRAKEKALAGCAVAVFMLFVGFVVVAETWFELWRSDALRAMVLGSAFRYAGLIMLIALFVSMNNDD